MTTSTCRYCGRSITQTTDGWVDPLATGDDSVWRETCDEHDTFEARHAPVPTLSEHMEFDHVVQVLADGSVHDAPASIYAPDLLDDEVGSLNWTLLDGFSGQYGYSGPMMHQSEFIGGGLARHILTHPGFYVSLVNYTSDDAEPESWGVAFAPADMTCGTCGRTWSSNLTPTPAARCPFEYDH